MYVRERERERERVIMMPEVYEERIMGEGDYVDGCSGKRKLSGVE